MDFYALTIDNGGGTFSTATNEIVTSGYAVGMVSDTFATCNVTDRAAFDAAILAVMALDTDTFGTWVDGDTIHIDPVMVLDNETLAEIIASENNQIAYYIIHENREVRLDGQGE